MSHSRIGSSQASMMRSQHDAVSGRLEPLDQVAQVALVVLAEFRSHVHASFT
jgi:hypothetical protein